MGKQIEQFTWLHVTDFHIRGGDPYDRNRVLTALVNEVRRLRETGKCIPDVIFATGDIAHGGKAAEYEQATLFFDALLAAAGLDKSRLFVIGGNHDADRMYGEDLRRTLGSLADADKYFAPDTPKRHFTKFGAFRAWHNTYFDGVRQLAEGTTCEPLQVFEVNGLSVAVAAINSALFCQDDQDVNKLWVGRRCLEPEADAVKASGANVRVALIHHPLEWLNEAERTSIQALLGDHFDIVLRGHLHEAQAEAVVGSLGSGLRIASGAAYQGSAWPNLCLYGTADYTGGAVRLYPIEYADTPRPIWKLATHLFSLEHDYIGVLPIKWKSPPPPPQTNGGGASPPDSPSGGAPPTTPQGIVESLLSRAQEPMVEQGFDVLAALLGPTLGPVLTDIRDKLDRLDRLERVGRDDASVIGRLVADVPVPVVAADAGGPRSEQEVRVTALIETAHGFVKKGKPSAAREILDGLLADSAESLPPDLEYRVHANIGVAAWEQEDLEAAERHIARARELQPDNPKAIANTALITLLQGRPEEAVRLAEEAMSRDLKVDNGASIYIQACDALGRVAEVQALEKSQPWILSDPFCALGLCQVYLDLDRFDEAERFARTAIGGDIGPHSQPAAHFLLAQALTTPVSDRIENDPPLRWRVGDAALARLNEAHAELTRAVELSSGHENRRLHIAALGVRAGVSEILGRYAEALADCNEVIRLGGAGEGHPESLDTAFINKATILLREERSLEALACFEAVKGDTHRDKFAGAHAAAYLDTEQPHKAIALLTPFWPTAAAGDRTKLDKVRLLITAHREAGDADKAREMVAVLEGVYPDDADVLVMRAEMRLRDGATDEALTLLRRAATCLKENDRDQIELRLAQLMSNLRQYSEAAEHFAKLVDEDMVGAVNPFILDLYVVCLYNAGTRRKALELAVKVRAAHGIIPKVAEVEARALDSIGDRAAALELRRALVEADPDRAVYHRLSCVLLLFQMGEEEAAREELATIDMEQIGGDPDSLMNAAQLRALLGMDTPLPFAYRARRLAFDSPEIHMAYMSLVLNRENDEKGLSPEAVDAGCAVRLERGGTSVAYVIEETEVPDRERFELAPTDPLAQRLIGLRAGDTAVVKERLGEDITYKVKEVLSKYIHAFQQSMLNFETWFPDHDGIEQVRVSAQDHSELQLRLDERRRQVAVVRQLYLQHRMPMSAFGRMIGRSLFEVWWDATQLGSDLSVFCATGQLESLGASHSVMNGARRLVLEPVSLFTVMRLGIGDELASVLDEIVVAQAVVDAVREWHLRVSKERPHRVMGRGPDGGYFVVEVTADDIARRRDFLSRALTFLRSKTVVRPVAGLLDMEAVEQEDVCDFIGRSTLASILLARDMGIPLYSDDLVLRVLATGGWKVVGVATQPLIEELNTKKALTRGHYHACLEALIASNYRHIFFDAEFLFWLLVQESGGATPRLTQAFQRLGPKDCDERSAVTVTADFVCHLWSRTNIAAMRQPAFEFAVENLMRLRGQQILPKLRSRLKEVFGGTQSVLMPFLLPDLLARFDMVEKRAALIIRRAEPDSLTKRAKQSKRLRRRG